MKTGNGKSQIKKDFLHEAFIDLYERFYKVQKGWQYLNILNPKSRLKLDSSKELKIAE
jgi:hypothetical protein